MDRGVVTSLRHLTEFWELKSAGGRATEALARVPRFFSQSTKKGGDLLIVHWKEPKLPTTY